MSSHEKITPAGLRTGLFGGSFNPPTRAHRQLADFVFEQLRLDRLLWIVAPHNPEKNAATLAPFEHRLAMVRQAIRDNPAMQASDIEQVNHSSWTIDTVRALRAEYPNDELFFMMGMDNWSGFHTWGRDFEQIIDNVSLIIMERPGHNETAEPVEAERLFRDKQVYHPDELKPSGTWYRLENSPLLQGSATDARTMLAQHRVPENITTETMDYIRDNALYGTS